MDCLFISPNSSKIYQDLANLYSAIEPPTWALLLAQGLRNQFGVGILDCDALRLSDEDALKRIIDINPRHVCFVVYGQNPNSGTTNMTGAISLAKLVKEHTNCKVSFVGTHTSALPEEVLSYKCIDYVLVGDGFYALQDLLSGKELSKIGGLGWKDSFGLMHFSSGKVVEQEDLDRVLPGYAWDLLPYKDKPLDLYRSHFWHTNYLHENRTPFASIYTSLGCVKKCSFCLDENTKVVFSREKNKIIKDVRKGDKLLGWNESLSGITEVEVIETANRQVDKLYRIVLEDGKSIKCTGEHPFFVNGKWIEAKDLKENNEILVIESKDKLKFRMERENPSFNKEIRQKSANTLKKKIKSGEHVPFMCSDIGKKIIGAKARERALSDENPAYKLENREKSSKRMSGENSPFWKGGSKVWRNYSKEFRYKIRYEIRFRDNYTCQECGKQPTKRKSLHVHHIDYDTHNDTECNLITLCCSCHVKTNQNKHPREYWIKRYRDKILERGITNCPHYVKIKSIIIITGNFTVYNLQCSPHQNFFANNLLTHNCVINSVNKTGLDQIDAAHSPGMRYWSTERNIKVIEELVVKYGVETLRISDEMFFLNKKYYEPLLNEIIQRGLKINSWTYTRVDTVKKDFLDLFKKAGINWLGIGVEAANQQIRMEIDKGRFKEVNIREVMKQIEDVGIGRGANYIFGFPNEKMEDLQATLNLALELNTEFANFYCATALPGSPLYNEVKQKGWKLPDTFEGYGFLAKEYLPLPTNYLKPEEVLKFRDEAWHTYFESPHYLNMMEQKFGKQVRHNIEESTKIKLRRNLLKP